MNLENRTYITADIVRLPITHYEWLPLVNQDTCDCEPYLVCASDSGNSWENDYTSAWIKLFSNSDSYTFNLKKDGVLVDIQPTAKSFINDSLAKYITLDWFEVFTNDGIGCYSIDIDYTISGVTDNIFWGEYKLFEFSNFIVDKTVRLKSVFNSNQSIEGIDFTNTNIVDTFRFKGYFGDRQPHTEIDNLIYSNRESKKVTRENINKYSLSTVPLKYNGYIDRIVDLYLLSENELYISDFNALNPTYNYLDLPVILSESPEIKYNDGIRKASLTATFNDKIKNSRSYY
ncbi:hypothetical protein UFOVP104_6 [uncultured Caudovirales phage]|uniref:Uncharacterized protein n=1 Tax=uncultured Caudovirales phage TaxID=2100421 RepID=A0A6J5LMR8_9CAUD|nr:hypothetical protein UFOVP104_6 [uncultured Caudovirales phage]CAB4134297.1 hypothetical protein UFOVP271_41 [uncultured Caudovirales phage]